MSDFVAVESRDPLRISRPLAARHMSLTSYRPAKGLAEAADTAMLLGVPLLLTGEPGTGKTRAAYWLANAIGVKLLRFDTKSTTAGGDLLYTFDEVARFRDASQGKMRPLIDYVTFGALGKAILLAAGQGAVLRNLAGDLLEGEQFANSHVLLEKAFGPASNAAGAVTVADLAGSDKQLQIGESEHCLVLVDELDKAPLDAPNDLLAEIENMSFAIRELGISVDASTEFRPVVLITSNSEKSLPAPFLRRCAFFDIPFPEAPQDGSEDDELALIVDAAIGELGGQDRLVQSAIKVFRDFRASNQIRKRPGTAELLAWIEILRRKHDISPETSLGQVLAEDACALDHSLSAVLKSKSDIGEGRAILRRFAGQD